MQRLEFTLTRLQSYSKASPVVSRRFRTTIPRPVNMSLLSFLQAARDAVLSESEGTDGKSTLVLGNSSCDLDSFVSSVVLSYFYDRETRKDQNHARPSYVPLLNLPTTPARELWRLRPEFGTALCLAVEEDVESKSPSSQGDGQTEIHKKLLANLTTLADLSESSTAAKSFSALTNSKSSQKEEEGQGQQQQQQLPVILVDHNAPSISNVSSEDLKSGLKLTGCIDHHVDENVIPRDASPRIITTGIGSCTSLIVQHLRDSSLWPNPNSQLSNSLGQLARLALAPILIDTYNLQATGKKCSDMDRRAVKFLESHFSSDRSYDRASFFDALKTAKQSSLDHLTLPEILIRDYKEWTESSSKGKLKVGIPSLVKPIRWLITQKSSSSYEKFLLQLTSFASDRHLDVLTLINKSEDDGGKFQKELLVLPFAPRDQKFQVEKIPEIFQSQMGDELELTGWEEDSKFLDEVTRRSGKVWWQRNTEMSRKQVAPGLRRAAGEVLK